MDSGSRVGPAGTTSSGYQDERGEVLTPTVSAIEAAENPLDRRAMVSLKKQLEIDKPQTSIDFSVSITRTSILRTSLLNIFTIAPCQGVPHVLLVRGKPQGTGVRRVAS